MEKANLGKLEKRSVARVNTKNYYFTMGQNDNDTTDNNNNNKTTSTLSSSSSSSPSLLDKISSALPSSLSAAISSSTDNRGSINSGKWQLPPNIDKHLEAGMINTAIGVVAGGIIGTVLFRFGKGWRSAGVATGLGVAIGSTVERARAEMTCVDKGKGGGGSGSERDE